MTNHLHNSGPGEQNVGQGDRAVIKYIKWLIEQLQWLWRHPEITWSGAGVQVVVVVGTVGITVTSWLFWSKESSPPPRPIELPANTNSVSVTVTPEVPSPVLPPAKSASTQSGGAQATVAGRDAAVTYNTGVTTDAFARYTGELAVTDAALTSFFRILEEQQVPRTDLDSRLREIAGQYKELLTLLKTVEFEDSEVAAEIKRVVAESGEYAKVEELLNQAEARDLQAIEELEQAAKQRRISAQNINVTQATLQLLQSHHAKAVSYWRKAASLVPLQNKWKRSYYLLLAGTMLHFSTDNYKEALSLYEQSLSIAQETHYKFGEMATNWNIGMIYRDQGDLAKAEQYMHRAVEIDQVHRAVGSKRDIIIGSPVIGLLPDLEEWHEKLEELRAASKGRQGHGAP